MSFNHKKEKRFTIRSKPYINIVYRRFKKQNPEYDAVPTKILGDIIFAFNNKIMETVIKERDGVELPSQLGYLFMAGFKPSKPLRVLWDDKAEGATKSFRTHNLATDGLGMKIIFTNSPIKYKYVLREAWAFTACRNFKKQASEAFKKEFNKYIFLDGRIKASKVFDRQTQIDYSKEQTAKASLDYNDFEIE